jgi:hypothetical protein
LALQSTHLPRSLPLLLTILTSLLLTPSVRCLLSVVYHEPQHCLTCFTL